MNVNHIIQTHKELTDKYSCNITAEDYAAFEVNKQLLKRISEIENSAMAVYDMHKKNFILFRSKINGRTSIKLDHEKNNLDHFFNVMHPDDLPFVVDTEVKTFNFLTSLEPVERKDYKLIFDFRLSNSKGVYFRYIQQRIVLELDKDGEIWLMLNLTDLVSEKNTNEPPQRQMINIKTGKRCLFNEDLGQPAEKLLSKREAEILGLISQGFDSREISEKLFICVNTVNNHRQNILSKTKTENTTQTLLYAKRIGII